MTDYYTVSLGNSLCLSTIRSIVRNYFPRSAKFYCAMAVDDYRSRIAWVQDILNQRDVVAELATRLRPFLDDLLLTDDIMVQSNLYLRAARPVSDVSQEVVGWHRESFYGGQSEAWNVWVPVMNVTSDNTVRYIPGSAEIPDETIKIEEDEDDTVAVHSPGHKIGLLYRPKRIVGGVDLSISKPMVVNEGAAAVFSSALIHGAGINRTKQIRFSVDFRVLAADDLRTQKHHFASGQDYFIPLRA